MLTQVEPDDFASTLRAGPLASTVSTPDDSVAYGNLTDHGFDQGVSVQFRVVGHEDEVLFFDLGVYVREPPSWPTT